jgi:hypothetical protein
MIELGIRVITTYEDKELLEKDIGALTNIFKNQAIYPHNKNEIIMDLHAKYLNPQKFAKEINLIYLWLHNQISYSIIEIDLFTNKIIENEKINEERYDYFVPLSTETRIKF